MAQAGDLQAKVTLGYFYAYGIGTAEDEAKAVALFEAAAKENHPLALYNLAVSYEQGSLGLPKDLKRALALFQQAAARDHAPSLHRLGLFHLSATGMSAPLFDLDVPRDPALGRAALERSVAAGHPQATADLARLLYDGEVLSKDLPRARKLFLVAAAHGVGNAAHDYAVMLEKGQGGPVDLTGAEAWYRHAQASGISEAAIGLARLLTRNAASGPDRQVEALAWCLWYHAHRPVTVPQDPLRNCTWARTGLGPEKVQAAQDIAQGF